MKRCKKCGQDKPRGEYRPEPRNADGLAGSCRECKSAYDRAYYEANREKVNTRHRAYFQAHREEIAAKQRPWSRAYYQAHREEIAAKERGSSRVAANKRRWHLAHQAEQLERAREYLAAGQAETLPQAQRWGYVWTGPELELAARTDLTAKQVALMTGRTLHAVYRRRGLLRDDPKTIALAGLDDPADAMTAPGLSFGREAAA